ncbi:SNF2 helicase associated domain-containing protein [Salicibibacter cibi]|uniref:SNF2 helicase associated domain-containing protein n=1 Tax=Salicibibacter cibi TaxID=2743001 RepID=A0A7T7CEH2_9BACI|nr:DEAD/DEAH box helicase [Salicibibacter cibi]QQK79034.1 SNF2 helicase associated domain-containing protein [Salicibibacter cibi]
MFKINQDSLHPDYIFQAVDNPRTYTRGEIYYYNDRVGPVSFFQHEKTTKAAVHGSRSYQCQATFQRNGDLDRMSCSCPAFDSYTGICKHLVAFLLELDELMSTEEYGHKYGAIQGHQMIDVFKEAFKPEKPSAIMEKETLDIRYELDCNIHPFSGIVQDISIRLRAGVSRPYVVKNIKRFIDDVQMGKGHFFTKKFSYHPENHQIAEKDREVLDLLWKISKSEPSGYSIYRQERELDIPDLMVPDLFELLEGRDVDIISGHTPETVMIDSFHSGARLEFLLQKSADEDEVELYLKEGNYLFFSTDHQLVQNGGSLYRLSQEQATIIQKLLSTSEMDGALTRFSPEEMEPFCSYVLPKLKEIAAVEMDEALTDVIRQYPLNAKMKIDYSEEALSALVTFQYGDTEINPYGEQGQDEDMKAIIVRDVETEATIESLLDRIPFTQSDGKLVLDDEEEMAVFLFEKLPLLQEYLDIYTTSTVRQMIAPLEKKPSVSLSTDEETNWLDVSFSVEGIPSNEVEQVLEALKKNQTYYRLPSGAFLHLQGEEFGNVKNAVDHFAPEKGTLKEDMKVPLYQALSLEDDKAQSFKLSSSLRQLMNDVQKPDFVDADPPEAINATLREYQLTGFRWLKTLSHFGLGGILADDMGLGKTLQTITYLQALTDENPNMRALIITPASLSYNWEKEFQRFAPDMDTEVIVGPKAERQKKLEQSSNAQVLITSYPLIQREADIYQSEPFDVLILDEAQAIKNQASKTAQAVRSLKKASAFALTGTPIENHLDELYSIFNTLLPGILGTKKAFKAMENDEVSKRVRPFILRRMKKDVLTELPEKDEQVQYTNLTDDQKKLYVAQVNRLAKDVDSAIDGGQFQEQRMQILAGLTKLRQICCHPQLVLPDESYKSGKFERLLEYVDEGLASGRRMVIFSQFTSMLSMIRAAFDERGWLYHYLDGQTPAKDRLALTERFNEGEHSLFLVSMKAGGTGLNLTGGDTVILFDTWWNPAVEQQAADRVHRFGQENNVQVIKLITSGTIEEKMLEMQERKKALVEEVIQPGEQQLTSLRPEDVKELLSV